MSTPTSGQGQAGGAGGPRRRSDERLREESSRFAAVDCGTNSVRLLISDGTTAAVRLMRITRLGKGVDATGRLDPEAMQRTLDVLAEYRAEIERHDVAGIAMAATSAARDASNRDEFFARATEVLGVEPMLLDGQREAEMSFLGATATLDPADGPWLVVDIGGGSTEFAVGSSRVEGSVSVQMGCVRMTEKHLHHDPPLPEELANCLAEVEAHLDEVVRSVPLVAAAPRMVGLAGTITNVAAVELGLPEYDPEAIHHLTLTKEAVEDVFRTLATEALAERVHNPGLERERADVIVGGCCVLVGIMRGLGLSEFLVSESDILDGLVLSQIAEAG